MKSTHVLNKTHQLAVEHGLGEPIRKYDVKLPKLTGLLTATVIFSLIIMLGILIAAGFHIDSKVLIGFSVTPFVSAFISLAIFVPTWRARKAAVSIYSNGFIMLNSKQTRAVRWNEVERVDATEDDTSCVVYLTDQTSLKPDEHIDQLKMLATELKVKVQLGVHPEMGLAIERQIEQFQNDPPWLQPAKMRANLFKAKEQFLNQKSPEEAYQLGEEYQLGEVLGTSRATLGSLLLPNKSTISDFICIVFIAGLFPLFLVASPPSWFGLLFLILPLQIIWQHFAARQSRLHLYEEGLIYIQSGSIDVVRWEQVEKTVCAYVHEFLKPYCTLHLKDSIKIDISKYLDEQDSMKRILGAKTLLEEAYPDKKRKNKDRYIDIGHLAD